MIDENDPDWTGSDVSTVGNRERKSDKSLCRTKSIFPWTFRTEGKAVRASAHVNDFRVRNHLIFQVD